MTGLFEGAFFANRGQRARVQQVLNVLVEAPFFYPADDPDLFGFLRRHREDVARFFEEAFGWQLVVEPQVARVYKPRWHNGALKRSQHDVFTLTRKDDCVAFLLVLDFYERLLEERGADGSVALRFEMGELFGHAKERLAGVDDDGVRRLFRELVPQLLRYRFLREVEADADHALAPERCVYECLPGLHAYDVRALGEGVLREVLGDGAVPDARAVSP